MTHDAFEIAIEQRLHGALDAESEEARALDHHLAECAACRDYEAGARANEGGIQKMLTQEASHIPWSVFEERAQRTLQGARRGLYILPLVGTALVLAQLAAKYWAHGGLHHHQVLAFAVLVPLSALCWWGLAKFGVRRTEADFASKGALTFYRDSVAYRIRVAKILVWAWPFELAAFYLLSRYAEDRELSFVVPCFALMATFNAAWSYFVSLPRLKREQQELA
jgi:predicted anti-sigma-YlaC factor YlaD